jgi:NAD(P)-dependent dehydrogenase (short-subunit alcohol dehydrogenase family)
VALVGEIEEDTVRAWTEMNVLVTGGGSGIGLDVARTLLASGAEVTIAGRSEERLEAARHQLLSEGAAQSRLHTAAADVSDEAQCVAAVAAATQVTGHLDAVVACAGEPRGQMAPVTHLDLDQWRSVFDNNVVATMLTLKHGSRELVRSGGGAFVAISSISAQLTARFAAPISAAKAAVEQLVRIAAHELGASNVTVNAIRPGLIEVDRQDLPEQIKDDSLAIIPLNRLGRPRDIAGITKFLIGPDAEWLTGQVISVDGGQTLVRAFDASAWVEPVFGQDGMRGLT